MATCQVDRISVVCEGGCGLICTATKCWSWCEPVSSPAVIPAIMILRHSDAAGADEPPDGTASLKMCVNGTTRAALAHVMQAMLQQDLESTADAAGDMPVEPFTGTVDDLLTHYALRRVSM
jgi:hypothetical protein